MCRGDKKDDASIDIPGVTLFGIFFGGCQKVGFTSENFGNYDFINGFPGGSWVINKHDQK